MIKDNLEFAENYYGISQNIKFGFEWLKQQDLCSIPDGKYVINNNLYANVQSYKTKENAPYEAHRKYIDIQYMVNGEERIDVTEYKNCSTSIEYDKDKDIEFLETKVSPSIQILRSGEFLVFFPQDAHKPSLDTNNKNFVKKVVVKVAI